MLYRIACMDSIEALNWRMASNRRRHVLWSARAALLDTPAALAFLGHATAERTWTCKRSLLQQNLWGPGILVPSKNSALLRWCLANGLQSSSQ